MPGFFGNSECAKIAKNLSPFPAADFSLFCHGFRLRGPSRPPHPLALGCRTAEFHLELGVRFGAKVAGLMWGLLAPTPPGRAASPAPGLGAGMPGLFRLF